MAQGTRLLGQVVKITPLELVVSLPNSLIGHIPITRISKPISDILQAADNQDSDNEDGSSPILPKLSQLFKVGQFLSTSVVSTTAPFSKGTAEKRHIELTIDPSQINSDINKADYVPGMAVQGYVSSVEDHGLIINLGVPSLELSAFISNNDLKQAFDVSIPPEPIVGQVLLLTVASVSSNGRTLTLTSNPLAQKVPLITSVESIKTVTAGVLVDATIKEVLPTGIVTTIYDHAIGTINLAHIPDHSTGLDIKDKDSKEKFIVGDRIKARVINTLPHIDPGYHVSLSILPHVLSLQSPFAKRKDDSVDAEDPLEAFPVGHIIDQAKVTQVDLNRGVFVDVQYKNLQGYVHISKISDKKPDALGPSIGPYRIGTVHKARVLDYCYLDNLYKITLQESALNIQFLNVSEITDGAITDVKVSKILPTGDIIVMLDGGIKGFVPSIYVSDVKLHFPEKKFKIGSKYKARVSTVVCYSPIYLFFY